MINAAKHEMTEALQTLNHTHRQVARLESISRYMPKSMQAEVVDMRSEVNREAKRIAELLKLGNGLLEFIARYTRS